MFLLPSSWDSSGDSLSHLLPEPGSRAGCGLSDPCFEATKRQALLIRCFHFIINHFRGTGNSENNRDEKGFNQSFKEQKPTQTGRSTRARKHPCHTKETESSWTSQTGNGQGKWAETNVPALPAPARAALSLLHLGLSPSSASPSGPHGLQLDSLSFKAFGVPIPKSQGRP